MGHPPGNKYETDFALCPGVRLFLTPDYLLWLPESSTPGFLVSVEVLWESVDHT